MPTWTSTPTLYVCPELDADMVRTALKGWGTTVKVDVIQAYGCPEDITADAENRIGFGPLEGIQMGVTRLKDDEQDVLERADIIINQDAHFGDIHEDSESYDLQSVVTHEIGHFLGLDGHFADTSSTLFSCAFEGDASQRSPTEHDLHALEGLYDGQEPSYQDIPCGGCSGAGMANGWLLAGLAVALLVSRWCTERTLSYGKRRGLQHSRYPHG